MTADLFLKFNLLIEKYLDEKDAEDKNKLKRLKKLSWFKNQGTLIHNKQNTLRISNPTVIRMLAKQFGFNEEDIAHQTKHPTWLFKGHNLRYRVMDEENVYKQAVIIFVTNEVGIGMLSLPAAVNVLGFFPGVLCIIVMGMLSLYSAYNLIQYWRKYPYMLNIVDYGRVLGGPVVEAIFAVGFLINMALISASALVTLTIGLNTVSEHATCTVVFTVVAAIAMWAMCVPHSMRFVSWAVSTQVAPLTSMLICTSQSWPCTISIIATVLIVMITLGVQGPRQPDLPLNLKAIGNPTFTQAVSAFLNIAFAYTGNQAFPTVLIEMENPQPTISSH